MMPALRHLLHDTMMFTALRGSKLRSLRMTGAFQSPEPNPKPMAEVEDDDDARVEQILINDIWRFRWNPKHPGTFRDVTCNTRGMGMDYGMPAQVFTKIEFRECTITRLDGSTHDLYLTEAHMLGAWWQSAGEVPAGDKLWGLGSNMDVGAVVAFGYQLTEDGIKPLSMNEVEDLGDELMPLPGWLRKFKFLAGEDDAAKYVCVGPCRYILLVELVLNKEKCDFVPGNSIGFARFHPHGLFWSNEDLIDVQLSIVMKRPALAMECGAAHGMKRTIGPLLVSDTNDSHHIGADADFPVPFTDNLYDYYWVAPERKLAARASSEHDHPKQRPDEVTMADDRFRSERWIESAVRRATLSVEKHRDIRKCKRQGQFDNVHLAARMKAVIPGVDDPTLDDIVMMNACVHDCTHLHVRWSEFLDSAGFPEKYLVDTTMLHGWSSHGPYTAPGLPQVPLNQTVFLSLPSSHEMKYRAVAAEPKAGALQVFLHHGGAYAMDEWPGGNKDAMLFGVDLLSKFDPYRGKFTDEWTEFYWRVRYKSDQNGKVIERLQFNLEKCMR